MPIARDLKLVKGDTIEVRALVDYTAGDTIYASVGDTWGGSIRVDRADASVVSAVLAAGDEVRAKEAVEHANYGLFVSAKIWPFGTVVAVVGDTAWIEWPTGASLEKVANLRRVRTRVQVEDLEPRPGAPASAAQIEPTPAAVAAAAPVDAEAPAHFPDVPADAAPVPVPASDIPEF